MKDSGLQIRIERELREKFNEVCRQQDRHATQVIREFMRQYIADAVAFEREEIKKQEPGC